MKRICLFLLLAFFIQTQRALAADATVIPEVNLRAVKNKIQRKDAQMQTTHITRQQIEASPVTHLSELLKREQSIVRLTNPSSDNSRTALSIRGFGDDAAANSLILVDGFPLTNPSLLAPNINSISLLDIERVDIFQGSEGALWGDQAVGGVVNIITRHPEKFIFDTQEGIGSYNKVFYSGLMGSKFNNGVFFKVFGFSNKADGYRQHNQNTQETLSAQIGVDYATGTLSFNAQTFNNTIYFPGDLSEMQYDWHPRMAVDWESVAHDKTNRYQLLSKQAINTNWVLETRASHLAINGDGFTHLDFIHKESMNTIEPRLIGTINRNKFILGYEGQHAAYQFYNARVSKASHATQHNLFAQAVLPLWKVIDLTLGVRDAWQQNRAEKMIGQSVTTMNRTMVTEQGVTFHLRENLQFYARRDGNFRFPKAKEDTWIPDNVTALKMQTGTSYETGMIWTGERHKTQLSLYRLQLHNEIMFNPTPQPGLPVGSFMNVDQTLRRGITMAEQYQLTPLVVLASQLNYVDARFANGPYAGKRLPAVPAVNGNIGLNYEFMPHWRAQYDAIYTGSAYASDDLANSGKRVHGYWLNTASLQYSVKYIDVSLEVGNVFNQHYSTYTFYDPETGLNLYHPGTGRTILLTLKTSLD